MNNMCILKGGNIYKIRANDKIWFFEMHPVFGPNTVEPRSWLPHSPTRATKAFWNAFERWGFGGNKFTGEREPFDCIVPDWCSHCGGTGNWIVGKMIHGTCGYCKGAKVVFDSYQNPICAL